MAPTDDPKTFTLNFQIMQDNRFKDGFYPALGTPTDHSGMLISKSFAGEIELMISSKASGMLCMGSMGRMESIRSREYHAIAKKCVALVSGKAPVLVGVMDCSVARVLDRIDALKNLVIDGVVATAPYYSKVNAAAIVNFFTGIAGKSKFPVFVYDLPSVTQSPVTPDMLIRLMKIRNIKGVKTANLNMILELTRKNLIRSDFLVLYSGLDSFDAAIQLEIKKNLDGMFTCTPNNSARMYEYMNTGDYSRISWHLNNILSLRNIFLKEDVLAAYSYAMELLGCPGIYHCDYSEPVSEKLKEEILACMKAIKEI